MCDAFACACIKQVRQSAGLLLKNNLRDLYPAMSEDFRSYIKVGPARALLGAGGGCRRGVRLPCLRPTAAHAPHRMQPLA